MPRIKQEELEEISLYSIRSPSGPHRGLIVTSFASLIVLVHSIYFTKFGVDTSKIQDELVFAFPIKKQIIQCLLFPIAYGICKIRHCCTLSAGSVLPLVTDCTRAMGVP
jgi:hypothetical protein